MSTTISAYTKQDRQKNNSGLKKCFQALVDRKQVNLDMCVLRLMLKYELQVDLDNIDPNLATVMPYMLVLYVRNWPGWQKSVEYYSGKLNYRDWFIKFRQYIIVRLNYLIKNGYNDAMKEINEEKFIEERKRHDQKDLAEKGTQTDFSAPKGEAPFTLCLTCPPKMLSSLVFCDKDDNIFLSHHPKPCWTEMTIKDLVNWPHVAIEFSSVDLGFKRYNRSEYLRFINFTSCSLKMDKPNFIEEVNILDPNRERYCYSLTRVLLYAQQYLAVLQQIPDISPSKIEVIGIVLEEFIKDIEEIEMNNTFASNTSVLFNIGKSSFVRNKKLSKKALSGNNKEVGFCETFIPKMETHFDYFMAVQDFATSDITFQFLNMLEKLIGLNKHSCDIHVPKLTFKCLFCDVSYNDHNDLISHFENEHGMEPNFVCTKCLKFFSINTLSRVRWKHLCIAKP